MANIFQNIRNYVFPTPQSKANALSEYGAEWRGGGNVEKNLRSYNVLDMTYKCGVMQLKKRNKRGTLIE